jgi:hypothetical protein
MGSSTEQLASEPRKCRLDTRFSSTELALIEKVATWRGLPPSAFVRGAALAAAKRADGHSSDIEDAAPAAPSLLRTGQGPLCAQDELELLGAGRAVHFVPIWRPVLVRICASPAHTVTRLEPRFSETAVLPAFCPVLVQVRPHLGRRLPRTMRGP